MQDVDALFEALRHVADDAPARAIEQLIRTGQDAELARINALGFAADRGLSEDAVIATLLHAARLGLVEMSWNILCPHCCGILDCNTTLKTIRQADYHCAFCQVSEEPRLDDTVEVSFTVSPRVRRIAAHDPDGLSFWDYHRQFFFGSAFVFPETAVFEALAAQCMVETVELQARDRMILGLQMQDAPVILFDPITHGSHHLRVEGEPTSERQDLSIVFDALHPASGRSAVRPGPLRLSLDNRTDRRVFLGVYKEGPALNELIGGRGPYLTAKRLLTNQTFRDVYRTDTLDVDQRLKILSLTFLFTDLKSSTELYGRVGDLVAYDLVRAHFRIIHDIVGSESGAVVKTIGDAVMATFPTPHQALSAALRMREAMRRLNTDHRSSDLILKVGLHEGPCLAVSLNDRQDYFGQTVNIASRVQELATADSIFATEPVIGAPASAALIAERGIVADRQARPLRSIGDSVPVFELAERRQPL